MNEAAFFLYFPAQATNSPQSARGGAIEKDCRYRRKEPWELDRSHRQCVRERPEELSQELVIRVQNQPAVTSSMEELSILRTFAAATTVLAAALVAANVNARVTVAGFMIFIVASIAWMADGWLETKTSLVIQNVILLLINAIGVWRWFPKAEKEGKS